MTLNISFNRDSAPIDDNELRNVSLAVMPAFLDDATSAPDLELLLAKMVLRIVAEEQANQKLVQILRQVYQQLDEDNENGPGHGHDRPGIWDSDNGILSGKSCAWCALWNQIRVLIEQPVKYPEAIG